MIVPFFLPSLYENNTSLKAGFKISSKTLALTSLWEGELVLGQDILPDAQP